MIIEKCTKEMKIVEIKYREMAKIASPPKKWWRCDVL